MAHNNPIRDSVLQAIGNTPVVRLRKVVTSSMADVLVKLEYYNPTGSYKDRMALAMIEGAEARGVELRVAEDLPEIVTEAAQLELIEIECLKVLCELVAKLNLQSLLFIWGGPAAALWGLWEILNRAGLL